MGAERLPQEVDMGALVAGGDLRELADFPLQATMVSGSGLGLGG